MKRMCKKDGLSFVLLINDGWRRGEKLGTGRCFRKSTIIRGKWGTERKE